MSNYTKATNFASKDTLPTGNPLKTLSGTEIDDEFTNIATAITSKANTSSPTFTGTPAAPTAASSANSTQVATTAFTQAAITAVTNLKAPLASPALTGVPTAPTAASGTDTTQVATTAYVQAALPTAQSAADIRTLGFFDTTNDGSGSGLDADKLDGKHASEFLTPTGDGSQLTGISTFTLPAQSSLTTATMTGNTNGNYASLNLGSGGAGWYYFQDFSKGCLLQYAKGWHNDTSDDDGVNNHAWSDTAGIFYCTTTPRLYSLRWGNNNDIYTGGSIKWVKIS